MSNGPREKLPNYGGRRDGALARVRDIKALVHYLRQMPTRPGPGIRLIDGPNGPQIATRSAASEAASRKWGLSDAGGGDWTVVPGRLWDGPDQVTITSSTLTFTPASGGKLYLEQSGLPAWGSSWGPTMKYSSSMGDEYTDDAGELEFYRKVLIEFYGTQPSGSSLQLAPSLWAVWRVGDADLLAIANVVVPDGTPVLGVQFVSA